MRPSKPNGRETFILPATEKAAGKWPLGTGPLVIALAEGHFLVLASHISTVPMGAVVRVMSGHHIKGRDKCWHLTLYTEMGPRDCVSHTQESCFVAGVPLWPNTRREQLKGETRALAHGLRRHSPLWRARHGGWSSSVCRGQSSQLWLAVS